MCGIAGMVKLRGGSADPGVLADMAATLIHRGPDAHGFHLDREAGLAHTRLSILDLSGGGQPMSNADGSLWITYNGEIFNYVELREELINHGHVFATRSDTEVLLHLYESEGEGFVERLNGQWAFAIWDARNRKLFASRDRMGIQPFFYTSADGAFYFASEIKALLACPGVSAELDLRGLDQIFTFWVTLPPRTSFRDISQLAPGTNLSVQDGRISTKQYWAPDYSEIETRTDAWDAAIVHRKADELAELLTDAVRIRLRADIPVGAYLSGGIDSSFITAIARDFAKDKLRTFSVTFDDAALDESAHQHEASSYLGTQHSEIRCSTRDIGQAFPEVVRHAEQPLLRTAPSPLFLLSKLVHDSGFRVVLTGEGADEILGGYDIFKEAKIRRFWAEQSESRIRPTLLRRLYPYMQDMQKQPPAYLAAFFHIGALDLVSPLFSHLPRWKLTSKLKGYYSGAVRAELTGYDPFTEMEQSLPESYARWPFFCQAQYLETRYLLPGYLLSAQADRMAMSHSVEARYPFLDHRVVNFAQKLGPELKMRVLSEKYLLKKAAENRVPDSILKRPKQPYRAPDGASLMQSVASSDEALSEESLQRDGVFEPSPVASLAAKFRGGRAASVKDNMALVGIASTQILMRQFVSQKRPTTYAVH